MAETDRVEAYSQAFFEVARAGWIQDLIDEDAAIVAIGPKI